MTQDRPAGRSRRDEDLPILPPMRLTVWLALVIPVLGTAAAGCRRAGPCPAGTQEIRSGDDAFWCRADKGSGKATLYVQLHPGSRQFRQRCSFLEGVLDGPFEAAHPGGQKWVQGRYQAGALAGKWVQWNPTGQKVAEGEYREGRLISGAPVAVAAICETIPRLQ
jgi:hypothetical protein